MIYSFRLDSLITNIHSRRNQLPLSLIMAKCCLPNHGKVCYDTGKFTKRGLESFIKYLIRPIFVSFCCSKGVLCLILDIHDSMDRIAFFIHHFYPWLFRKEPRRKITFILDFFLYGEGIKVSRKLS